MSSAKRLAVEIEPVGQMAAGIGSGEASETSQVNAISEATANSGSGPSRDVTPTNPFLQGLSGMTSQSAKSVSV